MNKPQNERDWLHGSRVLEVAAVKRLNASLPFADPIALVGEPTVGELLTEAQRCANRAAAILQAITNRHAA